MCGMVGVCGQVHALYLFMYKMYMHDDSACDREACLVVHETDQTEEVGH